MRRTAFGARAALEHSRVPVAAWAKALGVDRSSLWLFMSGVKRCPHVAGKAIDVLDRLDRGELAWACVGLASRARSWSLVPGATPAMRVHTVRGVHEFFKALGAA